jgi:citrate lyase subunit beta/citryl-CoA lyase
LNLREIAGASSRIESLSLGVDDYCLELGVEPSGQGHELFYPFSLMVTVGRANGIRPFGILGSVSDYKNMEDFEVAATKAKQLGSVGGYCIHPSQVAVLNRVFSPTPQEIRWAEKIIAAFEEALEQGRAATGLEGKMLDPPIYKRAKRLVAYSGEIERLRRGEA